MGDARALIERSGAPSEPAACHHAAMATPTPCWYCKHVIAVDPRSAIASCTLHKMCARSSDGCTNYERVPGIDDDAWSPLMIKIGPYVPEAAPAPRARGRDGWWTEPRRPRRPPSPEPKIIPNLPSRDPFGGLFNWNDDG